MAYRTWTFNLDNISNSIGWGKYKDVSFVDLLTRDLGYVKWMKTNDRVIFSKKLDKLLFTIFNLNDVNEIKEYLDTHSFSEREGIVNTKISESDKWFSRFYLYYDAGDLLKDTQNSKIKWSLSHKELSGTHIKIQYITEFEQGTIIVEKDKSRNKGLLWNYNYLIKLEYNGDIWNIEDDPDEPLFNDVEASIKYQDKEVHLPGFTDFVVKSNSTYCNKNHKVEDIVAVFIVLTSEGKVIEVERAAAYCRECNVYFIQNVIYESLKKLGTIMHQVITEKVYLSEKYMDNSYDLSDSSPLKRVGYSVGRDRGLSALQRRTILEYVVDSHLLSKDRVISYLKFFIDFHKNDYDAINSWKSDIDYISKYEIGSARHVRVNEIIRRI